MAFRSKGLEHFVARHPELATTLFFVMLVVSAAALVVSAVLWSARKIKQARLCALLINQMECTQQAERRSLNKSLAFANASHDIRGALAGLTTLIDLCYDLVPTASEVEDNLRKMHRCLDDLMELLNSILDTSKVEAGKMELEDAEFNLAQLLEEVADFYHPTAMKKGVEVVLDLCDGSVSKFAIVKGDRIKLKQIISNLVSNSVKFTPKGSISIRAWARRPSLETSMIVSHHSSCLHRFSRMFFKDEHYNNGLEDISTPQQNPDCMEYIIEVDDTGMGIPKDKQKSVFENFVQVRGNSLGHGGTGLGLGIVQSLVRLMGGDIGIVDKEPGMEGTRFKFNIFLIAGNSKQTGPADIEAPAERLEMVTAPDVPLRHRVDGSSLVVLLIHNSERRRVVRRYFERLEIKVSVVKHWEYLQGHLRRIKNTLATQSQNSTSDWTSSQSDCYVSGRSASRKYGKEVPLSSLDGTDRVPAAGGYSRMMNKGAPSFILFLVDVSAGPSAEMRAVVEEFRGDLSDNVKSKVVLLEKPAEGCNGGVKNLRPEDAVMSKPLHGSRLNLVVRILPEFGGVSTLLGNGDVGKEQRVEGKDEVAEDSEIQEEWSSSGSGEILTVRERRARVEKVPGAERGDNMLPLTGLRILVAEDTPLLATLAYKLLSMLGAVVHVVENGKEALEVVVQGLREGSSKKKPFDLILMDCQMPQLSGFEATREIRKAEKEYEVHIPIVALTGHTSAEQIKETEAAGMDGHLAKPVNKEILVQTITRLCLT